jgi:hypothetical protein
MPNKLIQTKTRVNTRNNRLVLNTNGGHCCCGPDTMATLFRACCNPNQTVWLLQSLFNDYVQAVNTNGTCYTRTSETASIADLDSRNIDWVGVLPPEWQLFTGACQPLIDAGYCPPCEPPPNDCCVLRTNWPCRRFAEPPLRDVPFESSESRCCVLGNYHRIRVNERAEFVRWGHTGNRSVNTFCDPFYFDIFDPLVQEEETQTTDVETFGECGTVRTYVGNFTNSIRRRIYRNDGFNVVDDRIEPINPRHETTESSSSGSGNVADPIYPVLTNWIPGGFFGLWLPERERTPGFPPLNSICDGEIVIDQDLDNDGIADNSGRWFVRGNIQCTGGRITYGYDVSQLLCVDSNNIPRYQYERMRWTLEWDVYDIDRTRCEARECSELGRPGPDDNLIVSPDWKQPGSFPTCRACRQQPGL